MANEYRPEIASREELVQATTGLLSSMEMSAEFSDGKNPDMQYAYTVLGKIEGAQEE